LPSCGPPRRAEAPEGEDLLRREAQRGTWYLSTSFGSAFLFAWMLTGPRVAAVTALVYAAAALPGVAFLRLRRFDAVRAACWGVPLGFAFSGLALLLVVPLAGWDPALLGATYAATVAAAVVLGRRGPAERDRDPGFPGSNAPGAGMHVLVPLSVVGFCALVYVPLSQVGALTEQGHGYAGLFGLDFLVRSVHALTIAQTGIPPENYYFSGEKITNYYLLWYLAPSIAYKLLGASVSVVSVMSVMCLYNVPCFLLLLYSTMHDFVARRVGGPARAVDGRRLAFVYAIVIFCSSYHWVFFLLKHLSRRPGGGTQSFIASSMGWMSQAWYRVLLFEPQVVMALMMCMLLLGLLAFPPGRGRGVVLGVVLSALAMTDVWTFMIVCVSYFLCGSVRAIAGRGTVLWRELAVTAATGLFFAGTCFALGIVSVQASSNALVVGANRLVLLTLPVFLVLTYGGSALLASSGLARRFADDEFKLLPYLLLTAVVFMVGVTETLEGNVVLRKAIYLAAIPVSLLAGCTLYGLRTGKWYAVALAAMILGAPTIATDLYATAGIRNPDYTTYVGVDVMRAAAWIRGNTPAGACVQSAVDYPGNYDYSPTIDFAERKAALGFWKMALLFYPDRRRLAERVRQVDEIFGAEDDGPRLRNLADLGIDYLVVGQRERALYPGCDQRFRRQPGHFRPVYEAGSVSVYQVQLR
jgi:hypothetical protein